MEAVDNYEESYASTDGRVDSGGFVAWCFGANERARAEE
jgi:hypothetical protein